jgi:hypothetical protein
MTVISPPVPPYANVPIQANFFQPSVFVITAVLQGQQTTITTNVNHNYVIGQLVRTLIPPSFGIRQLNEQEGYVLSIPSANQVIINIDSSFFDPFISSSAITQPQIMAIGDNNSGGINSAGNTVTTISIPGSFMNISPSA